jgi:hypothetical protein
MARHALGVQYSSSNEMIFEGERAEVSRTGMREEYKDE